MLASLAVLPASAEEERVYTSLYSSEVSTLNYLTSSTTWDYTPGANVVDTLIEYNNIGEIIPGLAETWEVSEDQLTWTFHLRQGQKWYDYTGAEVGEVTANDFVAAAKYVLTPEYDSGLEYMFEEANILNAAAYYAGEVTDFAEVGVKAVDDYTLQYIVDKPTPYLLSCMTYGSFMPAYGPQLEELGAEFAPSMVTALGKLGGATVGFIANQPAKDEGRLTVYGCKKAARFAAFCDCFSIPVITVVDSMGMKISTAPQGELSRAGAQLLFALSEANTPRIALVVGQAIGMSYAALASRAVSDMVYAWPGSVFSPVSAPIAAQLLYADEMKAAEDPYAKRAELEQRYMDDVADAVNAAKAGYVDDVIEPSATRQMLCAAVEMLSGKRDTRPAKKHGNMPL